MKRALVTGGTRGIGRAIAMHLRSRDIDVTVTGRNQKSEAPQGCKLKSVDFLDPKDLERFCADILNSGFDILVNNAGINRISPFGQIEATDFDAIQQVNVRAPFRLMQTVLPHMRKQKWGRIVNISSIFGKISKEQRASYSTTKFGLDGMSLALAAEVSVENILVNCVAPGFIDTDLTRQVLGENGMRELAEKVPMKRLGNPDEVARFVGWLVSDENTYLTGQNLAIDGGFSRV